MLKICIFLICLIFLLFSFWCFSKESFENKDTVLDFVEKIQQLSGGRLMLKKKEIYNPDLAFVELESVDKERVLFSVFQKKKYAILEKIWFVKDDGYMTIHQDIYRLVNF